MRRKISVCIPTYNGERYIREQLESILNQLDAQDEVIISDDNSTDRTLEIIQSLNDSRIRIYHHLRENNPYRGLFRTLYCVLKNVENAMRQSTGSIVFLSDQDDVWLPGKVDRVLQEFQQGADLVLHDSTIVDAQGYTVCQSTFECRQPSMNPLRVLFMYYFQGAAMAFSKQVKEDVLPFPSLPICHDHWIGINAFFRKRKIAIVRKQLLLYRRHGNNVSVAGTRESPNPLYFKVMYRIFTLQAVLKIIKSR